MFKKPKYLWVYTNVFLSVLWFSLAADMNIRDPEMHWTYYYLAGAVSMGMLGSAKKEFILANSDIDNQD